MLWVEDIEVGMSRWALAMRLTGVGFFIGVCVAGGAFLGWWLGGENYLFMIAGLLIGLVVAIYGVYQMLRPLMNNRPDKENH